MYLMPRRDCETASLSSDTREHGSSAKRIHSNEEAFANLDQLVLASFPPSPNSISMVYLYYCLILLDVSRQVFHTSTNVIHSLLPHVKFPLTRNQDRAASQDQLMIFQRRTQSGLNLFISLCRARYLLLSVRTLHRQTSAISLA